MKGLSNWLLLLIIVFVLMLLVLVFGAITVDIDKIPILNDLLRFVGILK